MRLLAEVHDQVAGLLGGPRPGGVQGDSEDADAPGGVLDHGQDVGLGAFQQVGCEEVARQDRLGLGAQELRPGRVCSSRRGVDPGLLQISHTVDAAIFAPRPTSAGSCPVTSSRSPWRRTFGITANNVARKCPIRPVQVRAARLPPLQDGELVAQDQDLCGLPSLLMPDSRSHEDARVISR